MNKNDGKDFDSWSDADKKTFEAADGKAEYAKCVAISTRASIREMIIPGLVAVLVPVAFGFGPSYLAGLAGEDNTSVLYQLFNGLGGNTNAMMLGGLLAGVTVSGVLMALFQSNAGGAWDNAKKMIEEGAEVDGQKLGKGKRSSQSRRGRRYRGRSVQGYVWAFAEHLVEADERRGARHCYADLRLRRPV